MFAYCNNNPIDGCDPNGNNPIWSFENDWAGRRILYHWLFGEGEDYVVTEGRWGNYMRRNELLNQQIEDIVKNNSQELQNGESVFIDITTSAEIENGESIIGYQYLHGTNEEVGGFHVIGEIRKDDMGNINYDNVHME